MEYIGATETFFWLGFEEIDTEMPVFYTVNKTTLACQDAWLWGNLLAKTMSYEDRYEIINPNTVLINVTELIKKKKKDPVIVKKNPINTPATGNC